MLEIVEDRRASEGGVGIIVKLADVPRLVGIAQRPAAREGHRAGDTQWAGVGRARIERVDDQVTGERGAQGRLGVGGRELRVLGADFVDDTGDQALPVLVGLRGEAPGEGHRLGHARSFGQPDNRGGRGRDGTRPAASPVGFQPIDG